jgi:hypothetical protein
MSDTPQGPGWWQASDGKWYPPEQQPGSGGAATTPPAGSPDIGASLSFAWEKLQQNIGPWLIMALAPFVVFLVFAFLFLLAVLPAATGDAGALIALFLMAFVALLAIVAGLVVSRGLYRAALGVCEGRSPDPRTIFQFDNIGPFVIVSFLYGLAIFIGMILCLIPGLIAAVVFAWAPWAVVDRDMEPVEAMKYSLELVKQRPGEIILFLVVIQVINGVAGSVCGLLLLATVPLTLMAQAYGWRQLAGKPTAI